MKPRALSRLEIRDNSPLAHLLAQRQDEQGFIRNRRFSHLLDPFQLKYSVTSEVNGRHCVVNGRRVIHFASSNYLGLEQHPEVLYASKRAIDELGTDTGCHRLVSSHSNILELEAGISQLMNTEATLIGQSTSQIHAGVIPVLFGDDDSVLFLDKNAHPDMHQAALIAAAKGARIVKVDVSNPPALREILQKMRSSTLRGALLVDGIYSVHGHMPDLTMLDELCRACGIILYIDDSHGVGVLGRAGGGVVDACGLNFENLIVVGSLQKAFGTFGGFVSGRAALVGFLRVTSQAFMEAGSLQPAAVEGALASVRIARSPEGHRLRAQLSESSRRVRAQLQSLGFIVPPGDSPVIPVAIGRDLKTLMAGRKLFDLGIFLSAVSFPEVPRGRGVLRISITTLHSDDDIEKLLSAFRELRHYLPKHENPLRQAAHLAMEVGKAKWQGAAYAGL